jgi:hypothetical protein
MNIVERIIENASLRLETSAAILGTKHAAAYHTKEASK